MNHILRNQISLLILIAIIKTKVQKSRNIFFCHLLDKNKRIGQVQGLEINKVLKQMIKIGVNFKEIFIDNFKSPIHMQAYKIIQ